MSNSLPPPRIDLLVYAPSSSSLLPTLSTLLEPSSSLAHLLIPQLHTTLQSLHQTPANLPKSYHDLLDLCSYLVAGWDLEDQANFIAAHPRIGETKGLSKASSIEQGNTILTSTGETNKMNGSTTSTGGNETPGEVLKRLGILNSLYEDVFPGLRFITFVNGRPRSAIVPEIESILGLALPPPSASTPEPTLGSLRSKTNVQITGSKAWRDEMKRALEAIWDIGKARLDVMGVY